MAKVKYYSEDELVQKIQSGEYGWLDFVNHHSRDGWTSMRSFAGHATWRSAIHPQNSLSTSKASNLRKPWDRMRKASLLHPLLLSEGALPFFSNPQ